MGQPKTGTKGVGLFLPTFPETGARGVDPPESWEKADIKLPDGLSELAWHHIIPYRFMRTLWNALVNRTHNTQLAEPGIALYHYLQLCAPRSPDIDRWVKAIRGTGLDYSEYEAVQKLAMYPPWDFVQGPLPKLRAEGDDPKDAYIDRYSAGLTSEEKRRMQAVEKLYGYFTELMPEGKEPTASALRTAADVFRTQRQSLVCDFPIWFRIGMWVQQADGKWRKRFPREELPAARQSAAGRS